jgi:hypothetical protein
VKLEANLDGSLCSSDEDLRKMLPCHRAVFKVDDRYYGWTGQESFGVIRRHCGRWKVTCWADVLAWTYGRGRIVPIKGLRYGRAEWDVCFDKLEEAFKELDDLMDIAERMGRLHSQPPRQRGPV